MPLILIGSLVKEFLFYVLAHYLRRCTCQFLLFRHLNLIACGNSKAKLMDFGVVVWLLLYSSLCHDLVGVRLRKIIITSVHNLDALFISISNNQAQYPYADGRHTGI